MAIKTVLIDDIDGTALSMGSASTKFSLNGASYEIDLAAENVQRLKDALAPFIAVARRSGSAPTKTRGASNSSGRDLTAIRTWARANGFSVSDRGRVSAEIIAAYDAAH